MQKNRHIRTIVCCRSCGSKKLVPVLSLGNLYISDFIKNDDSEKMGRQPLDLAICDLDSNGCGLLQLKHTYSPEIFYRNYWYRSGINKSMADALLDVVRKTEKIARPKSGDYVIDIGANDGTLFSFYKNPDLKLVGFEPAKNLMPYAKKNCPSADYINDFFNFEAWHKKYGEKKAKIITAIAMFYDLDDPNKFVSDIAKCLDQKGVFVIQMSYLPSMLSQNAFDNICSEHLEYYSLASLNILLKRHNLEVFDAELNDVNGGSFRTYIQRQGQRPIHHNVRKLEKLEKKLNLAAKKTYRSFASRIIAFRKNLLDFIKRERAKGKKIYGYGASTKGNTLLQFYKLNSKLIEAIADRNPDKWGAKTVGTLIPIISEEEARKQNPDYFLVLPWHFLKEFIQRESEFLKRGGKFIIPLPEFKIISGKAMR